MEVLLNNVWMALTTPNEKLLNILLIPMGIIECFLVMLLLLSIFNITANRKQKLLYVTIEFAMSLLNIYVIPSPFNILLNYLVQIVVAYYIFNISFLKSTTAVIISAIIYTLIGVLISNPYLTVLQISSEQLNSIILYRFFYLLLIYASLLFISFIVKNRKFKLNFLEDIDKNNKYIILGNLFLGFFTLILQTIIIFYYIDILPMSITFLSFILLLAYFSISIFSLTRIMKLTQTTRKLQSAEEYNHSLRVLHDNVRSFKHDFDNIVTTIGGYIRTNDMKGLENYYVQLEDDCQRVNNLYILNPEVVNNDGIYNLLTKKYNEADSKNIKVNISFLLDLDKLNMKIYEFARILGILLDNAIEASDECEEKVINLTFRNDLKNNRQLIIVENTYFDKTVDTEKIFEKGVSGKENHTGLGLWEVRKIVKKNKNANLFTSKSNKFFSQQLELY